MVSSQATKLLVRKSWLLKVVFVFVFVSFSGRHFTKSGFSQQKIGIFFHSRFQLLTSRQYEKSIFQATTIFSSISSVFRHSAKFWHLQNGRNCAHVINVHPLTSFKTKQQDFKVAEGWFNSPWLLKNVKSIKRFKRQKKAEKS